MFVDYWTLRYTDMEVLYTIIDTSTNQAPVEQK